MCGILNYFLVVKKTKQSILSNDANLPEPNGPLSKVIPSPAIATANEKVSTANNAKASATRGAYLHLTGLLVNKLTGKFRNIYTSFVLLDQLLILL